MKETSRQPSPDGQSNQARGKTIDQLESQAKQVIGPFGEKFGLISTWKSRKGKTLYGKDKTIFVRRERPHSEIAPGGPSGTQTVVTVIDHAPVSPPSGGNVFIGTEYLLERGRGDEPDAVTKRVGSYGKTDKGTFTELPQLPGVPEADQVKTTYRNTFPLKEAYPWVTPEQDHMVSTDGVFAGLNEVTDEDLTDTVNLIDEVSSTKYFPDGRTKEETKADKLLVKELHRDVRRIFRKNKKMVEHWDDDESLKNLSAVDGFAVDLVQKKNEILIILKKETGLSKPEMITYYLSPSKKTITVNCAELGKPVDIQRVSNEEERQRILNFVWIIGHPENFRKR